MSARILLVEDDEDLGRQIVGYLRDAGLEPTWLRDGAEAQSLSAEPFDLVILDLMLPGAHGLDVLKELRRESDLPVLVLSARNDTGDKVRALELGADDFVTKPFWPEELLARVQARLRRPVLQRVGLVEHGELAIELDARRVRIAGAEVDLTRLEFDLLAALVKRPGAAISRGWLVERLLDADRDGADRALDAHVSRLRKKLGSAGKRVETVWGVGYRFEGRSE